MPVGTNSIKIISSTSEWLFTPCISEDSVTSLKEFTGDGVSGIKIVFLQPTFKITGYGYHSDKR